MSDLDDRTRRLAILGGISESHRLREYKCSKGHFFYSTEDFTDVDFQCVQCTVAGWTKRQKEKK